jgi:hypothetical protein
MECMVGSCRLTGQPHSPLFFSGLHDFSVEILNRLRCVLALHGNMEKFWIFFSLQRSGDGVPYWRCRPGWWVVQHLSQEWGRDTNQ